MLVSRKKIRTTFFLAKKIQQKRGREESEIWREHLDNSEFEKPMSRHQMHHVRIRNKELNLF